MAQPTGKGHMGMTVEDVVNTLQRFQGLIGRGSGKMIVHFAEGNPQKVHVEMSGDAVHAASERKTRIAR